MALEDQDKGLQNDESGPVSSEDNSPLIDEKIGEESFQDENIEDIPDVDDRGVPKENVLSEVRKKINVLTETNTKILERLDKLQSPQTGGYQSSPQVDGYQPIPQTGGYQSQNQQQVISKPQNRIPKTIDEASQIVADEVQAKYDNGEFKNMAELTKYQTSRMLEMNQILSESINKVNKIRAISETNVMNLYPDLKDYNSPLAKGVVKEIQQRAMQLGYNIYSQDPYCLENIVPNIASRLGILPKQVFPLDRKKVLPSDNLIPGRTPPKKPEEIVPTETDILLSGRYGTDPKEVARIKKESSKESEKNEIIVTGILES